MRWPEAVRARLCLLLDRRGSESRMEEEIRFHLERETERLIREEGLDPREARRRTVVSFGGVEKTKEELPEGRGLAWLSRLRLDLKLGLRMLGEIPGDHGGERAGAGDRGGAGGVVVPVHDVHGPAVGAGLISLTVAESPEGIRLVAGVAAAMVVVGMLGCLIPAVRALRVQPVEALRAE